MRLSAVLLLAIAAQAAQGRGDWLLSPPSRGATLSPSPDGVTLSMDNGLIRRTLRLKPNAATTAFDNLMTGASLLRGVKPEALLTIDGVEVPVGGLDGQPDYAYLLPRWLDSMTANPKAFRYTRFRQVEIEQRLTWKRPRYAANAQWPPRGVGLILEFTAPDGPLAGVRVDVHYELYDGLPVLAKWLVIHNGRNRPVRINRFVSEILAVVEDESMVEGEPEPPASIYAETDYQFGGMDPRGASRSMRWVPDPQYVTQVNYRRRSPYQLEASPPLGPDAAVAPGESFETFRTFLLVFDSFDRERRSLAKRRMYRTLAPWGTENPILMHVRQSDPASVRTAIDQCAEVGFEMVILSFGSGFDAENDDPAYLAQLRELAAYGRRKGVELGGYSLLASRRINPDEDAINPKTGQPGGAIFDNSPCLSSRWGQAYFRKLKTLYEATGLMVLEHDGSYPGDVCASTKHPGHEGLQDSQWRQFQAIREFYRWCRERGIYLNVPDWYFLNGSNKTAMGYRETNWSLPRERQFLLGRQNIYDGTWDKTPSMGWMFVPLTQYQGGGAAATLEPLKDHLDAYEQHLAQNFGSGVQACYRGPRLYDSDQTKAVLRRWVDFYKAHRQILDSDVIHLRRPDGRDWDGLLHVNPAAKEKGLAMIFNPTAEPITPKLRLPLYYTGLSGSARISVKDSPARRYRLDEQRAAEVTISIPAGGWTWLVIQ